jgi:carbon monoxide dehydrogenase subunit G
MKVSGDHDFRASRAQVWDALNDPGILAGTLPGARRLEPTGPDEYALTVDVGVGSVKGTYEGTFALTDKRERESCTVTATASGRPGSVTAVASMRLSDNGQGARMSYEADATITGPLAGVGQRLMGAAARRTTEQFLSALDERIVSGAPAPEAAAPGAAVVPAARGGTDPKVIAASALAGFCLALIGVAVGRWTARR